MTLRMETRRFPPGREVNRITCPYVIWFDERYVTPRAVLVLPCMRVCVFACTLASSTESSRRAGGRKIYGRLHGVYRKLAIVINVLYRTALRTCVLWNMANKTDLAPDLYYTLAPACTYIMYLRWTRRGRLFDFGKESVLYDLTDAAMCVDAECFFL